MNIKSEGQVMSDENEATDDHPYLPICQIRVRDEHGFGPSAKRRQVQVWVDGEPVAQIPATAVSYDLPVQGPGKLRVEVTATRAEIDGREPGAAARGRFAP